MTSDPPTHDAERRVTQVPFTLGAMMGVFVVVATIVRLLIWAL